MMQKVPVKILREGAALPTYGMSGFCLRKRL
mgnify:CR=1 FL=1